MTPEEVFLRYRDVLQSLSVETLDRLDAVVAPDVRFRDPFHDVSGADSMKGVFSALFESARNIVYDIDDWACGADSVYFRWTLKAELSGKPWSVTGVTQAHFDDAGRVSDHVEYWDAASQFYERFPVIGSLLRCIRRRIARP